MSNNDKKEKVFDINPSVIENTFQYQESIKILIHQINTMIDIKNHPNFDTSEWLENWLSNPLPALGGAKPASYLGTIEGQRHISNLLAMMQSGSYA